MIACAHHERWDGTGYGGIRGSDIPLEARITTVADATAIVISASSGTVSVYDAGETVLELEQAHLGS